jgi:uncharacterized protein (DUF2267 family)
MKYDEFVGQVQNRAQLGSRGEAVAAIRATLENLAMRLNYESADKLASQLPREIGYYMTNAPRADYRAERVTLDEFFERVAESEPADLPDAVYHARVVMEVVSEAVSRGEIEKLVAQLPDEFDRFVYSGSEGRMRGPRPRPRRDA